VPWMWGLSKVLRQLLSSIRCSKEDPGKETKTFERPSEKNTNTKHTQRQGRQHRPACAIRCDSTVSALAFGCVGEFPGSQRMGMHRGVF